MDFTKIIDMLTKSNIDNEGIYNLISEASSMDLSKEENCESWFNAWNRG